MSRRFLPGAVAAFALLAALPAVAQDVTLVMPSNVVGVPTYNPMQSVNTNTATWLIYDQLVARDAQLAYQPALAESWEGAPDGMSWTFHLRRDVTFHDGTPFNADVIPWWIEQYRGTENAYMVEAIDHVEVVDPHTVRLVMKRPDPNLLFDLSTSFMGVPSPAAVKAMGKDYGVRGAIGTGPMKLKEFRVGQETVLERNPDYRWGPANASNRGPAKVQTLTIREIPDQATAFLELKTGGVDGLLSVPTDFLPQVRAQKDLAVITAPGPDVMYMPINVTKAPFDDLRVRRAAALAIDQEAILKDVFHGVGLAAHSFLISALPESRVAPEYAIAYDPARAKALLDEAGWAPGPDGVRVKDGRPLAATLWTQADSEFRRVTEVVQAQLAAVGIKADISVLDASAIRAAYKKNAHMLAVRSYSWANADILDWFFSAKRLGYPNISMFNDPKAEALDAAAMTGARTPAERSAAFIKYHEYILSQVPFAPIYQPVQTVAYNRGRITLPEHINAPSATSTQLLVLEMGVK